MPEFASNSNPYMGIARNLGEIFFENPHKNRILQQHRAEEAERKQLRELREVQQAVAREEQQKRSAAQAMLRDQREQARQQIPGMIRQALAPLPADLPQADRERHQAAVNLTNQLIQAGMTPTPILRALNIAPVMPINPNQTRMAVPYGARGGRNLRAPMHGPERPTWPFHEGIKVGGR